MKNITICFAAFLLSTISLCAQKTATWKGGCPGQPNEWNCSKNWQEGRIPNEFSDVLIPNVANTSATATPVIRTSVAPVNSLTLLPGAALRIEKSGTLEVLVYSLILEPSTFVQKGELILPEEADEARANAATPMATKGN